MNYYKISEPNLIRLLSNSVKLEALELYNVQDWEWYDEALANYWDEYVESYPAVIKYALHSETFDEYAIGRYKLSGCEKIQKENANE